MKTSCIRHPAKHSKIVISQWQLDYCDGDHATAALLSYFEYWHNIRLGMIEQQKQLREHMQRIGQTTHLYELDLLQFHTEAQLIEGIQRAAKSAAKIRKCLHFLEEKGVISIHQNPKVATDRTRFFLFHPDVINAWIDEHYPSEPPQTPSNPARRQALHNDHSQPEPTPAEPPTEHSKTCPVCSAAMTQRQNKAGQAFWGCTAYPKCKHTESVEPEPPPKKPPKPPPKTNGRRAIAFYSNGKLVKHKMLTEQQIEQLIPFHKNGVLLGYELPG